MAQWLDLPLKFRSPGSAKKSEDVEQEVVIRGEVL